MEDKIKALIEKLEGKLRHYEAPQFYIEIDSKIYVDAKAEVLRAVIADLKKLLEPPF